MTLPSVTVSVVSHGHGSFIRHLLRQLDEFSGGHVAKVVLTTNIPEPDLLEWVASSSWMFAVHVVNNEKPLGFGDNHNRAFKACSTPYFCVINPDVELTDDPFQALLSYFENIKTGCVYPLQTSGFGHPEDQAREIPSPGALFRRYFWSAHRSKNNRVRHWVNGSFMLFRSEVFDEVKGFDTTFFMYCEDVDICLRLQLAGYFFICAHDAKVIHLVQRKSHQNFRHITWHLASLWALWRSKSYKKFRTEFIKNDKNHVL